MGESTVNRNEVMRKSIPFVAAIAIAAVGFAWPAHVSAMRNAELDLQKARIEELSQMVDDAKNETARTRTSRVDKATGSDRKRARSDADFAEQFLTDCASWDSFASYDKCREIAMSDYGLSEDGQFLTSYMPKLFETEFTDGSGSYNYIDAEGLNSRVYGFDDYLVAVDGDTYSHFALVTFRTTSDGRSADSNAIMRYSVDGDGNFVDVEVEGA